MDPFQMNDFPIKKFLIVVLTFQVVLLCLLALDAAGYGVPFLTQVIGALCTLFIPGFLLLRILRLHRLGSAKTVLYAVGLSVAFMPALGLLVNFLYPLAGIARPLDRLPLVITFFGAVLVLCGMAWWRDRTFSAPLALDATALLSPVPLFFILLPLLAVLGAQMVNNSHSNLVLMVLMVLLALVPLLAIFTHRLPERWYPLAIFSVAVSLLLHRTLISDHLWGADILGEFACYRTVAMNGVWQPYTPGLIPAYNTSLAVTILPAALSQLLDISGFWVFKLVFPVLLAFVPLAMYETVRLQFSAKTAFLATFLLMSLYPFYTTLLTADKQLIATLFLALFLLTMTDHEIEPLVKKALLVVFGTGIAVSHYSTAFLLVVIILATLLMLLVLKRRSFVLSLPVFLTLLAVTVGWYFFISDGAVIKQFAGMGKTAVTTVAVSSGGIESYRLITQGSDNLPGSLRVLYLVTQGLIGIGGIVAAIRWLFHHEESISGEFMVFSLCFAGLLGLELVLPQFSMVISLDRIYPIALLVLAPFCIYGATFLYRQAAGLFKKIPAPGASVPASGLIAVFLGVFLLANTGFIYELAGKPLPTSIALSRDKADFPVFSDGELAGAGWFLGHVPVGEQDSLYYDTLAYHLFVYLDSTGDNITGKPAGQILYRPRDSETAIATDVPTFSHIFLRSFNLRTGELALGWPAYQTMDVRRISTEDLGAFAAVLSQSNVIYTSNRSQVLYTLNSFDSGKDYAHP